MYIIIQIYSTHGQGWRSRASRDWSPKWQVGRPSDCRQPGPEPASASQGGAGGRQTVVPPLFDNSKNMYIFAALFKRTEP
jgi:hypothetical protein